MTVNWITRRDLLQVGGAAMAGVTLAGRAKSSPPSRKKVLFLTKSAGYQHAVVRRVDGALAYAEHALIELGNKHGFDVEASKDASIFDGNLESYAAFAFFTTGDLTTTAGDGQPAMSPEGKQAFLNAIRAGKGFVGFHCASDTFHTPGKSSENQVRKDPYIAMLGGEFMNHGRQQKARMKVVNPAFPGIESLGGSFLLHEEWYSLKNFAQDMHVLLVLETEGMDGTGYQRPPFPATWARREGRGRVFYTSMGHREDVWTNPAFQSIAVGGIQWALGNIDADVSPNINDVTPQATVLLSPKPAS